MPAWLLHKTHLVYPPFVPADSLKADIFVREIHVAYPEWIMAMSARQKPLKQFD
jgi:hypothetical protein